MGRPRQMGALATGSWVSCFGDGLENRTHQTSSKLYMCTGTGFLSIRKSSAHMEKSCKLLNARHSAGSR